MIESPHRIFGTRDFPYLKPGIRDFKAKLWRDSGLKVCAGGGMTEIILGITRSFGSGLRDWRTLLWTQTIVTACRTKINKLQLFSVFMLISRLCKSDCWERVDIWSVKRKIWDLNTYFQRVTFLLRIKETPISCFNRSFPSSKTLPFKTRLSAKPFLW